MKIVSMIQERSGNKRIRLGMEYLVKSLQKAGYEVQYCEETEEYRELPGIKLYAGDRNTSAFLKSLEEAELLLYHQPVPEGEGFYLRTRGLGWPEQLYPAGVIRERCMAAWSWRSGLTGKARFLMRSLLATHRPTNSEDLYWAFRKPSWSRRDGPIECPDYAGSLPVVL